MFNELTTRRGFSLERLISFCEVAKAGSITRAADGNASRQSQYSRQIKELESFFDVDLTKKDKRSKDSGLLTVHGEKLREVAQQSLGALEDFARQVTAGKIRCRLAAGNSLLTWLIIPLLSKDHHQLADVDFHLIDMDAEDILNGLQSKELDIGIVRTAAVDSPQIKKEPLKKISYVIAAPKKWGAKSQKDFLLRPLAEVEDSQFFGALRKASQKHTNSPTKLHPQNYVCRDACQCLEFVRKGKAAAIVPEFAPLEDLDRVRAPWLKSYEREVSLVWHNKLSEGKRQIVDVLKELLRK